MSRTAPLNTLRLLGETHSSLPQGSWVTGPVGLAEFMQMRRRIETKGAHWRMILDDPGSLEAFEEVVDLDVSALGALADLHASDPSGAFWMPEMLEINPFVGIWDDDLLVASAGTHVISERFGVAAVGAVITRPSHRGRGLAGRVVSTLCSRLWARFETIGLNVEVANPAALNVYDRLGFRRAFRYEEVELG